MAEGVDTSGNEAIAELKRVLTEKGFTESYNEDSSETVLTSPDKYHWVTIGEENRDYAISVWRGSNQCARGTGEWENLSMEELPEIYEELYF